MVEVSGPFARARLCAGANDGRVYLGGGRKINREIVPATRQLSGIIWRLPADIGSEQAQASQLLAQGHGHLGQGITGARFEIGRG